MVNSLDDWTGAQLSVIGSALVDGSCVPEILAEMRPEDFSGEHRRYYEAFIKLSSEGVPVDPVTVLNVIGPEYRDLTVELMRLTPTSANVSAYIAVCKEQSRLRLLRDCGEALTSAATLGDAREALNRAAAISLETGRRTAWTAGECVTEWFDALNRNEKPEYISCGIGPLDKTLRTVAGNFVIIAGYTSHGKSALALQMAWAVCKQKRVGFLSFETSKKEWTDRLIAYVSKVPLQKVQDNMLTLDEVKRCKDACIEISRRPLSYERASGFTLDDLRAQVLRHGYEVVFVDYLQKIVSPVKKFGRVQEVTEISSGLQTLAQQYGVTVYALSQLSRPPKNTDEFVPPPGLPDLRESGQIEQDADAVLFVHGPLIRSTPYFRLLDVAKNRSGVKQRYYADFNGETQTFSEPTREHAESYRRIMSVKKLDRSGSGWTKLTDLSPADNPFEQQALNL